MADYSARISALEDAAASGELEITINGERVVYRSMDDLLKALGYFRSRQTAEATTTGVAGVTLATFAGD